MWRHWVTWCGCPAVAGDATGVFPPRCTTPTIGSLVTPSVCLGTFPLCLPAPVCMMCDVSTCGLGPPSCVYKSLGRPGECEHGRVVRRGGGGGRWRPWDEEEGRHFKNGAVERRRTRGKLGMYSHQDREGSCATTSATRRRIATKNPDEERRMEPTLALCKEPTRIKVWNKRGGEF